MTEILKGNDSEKEKANLLRQMITPGYAADNVSVIVVKTQEESDQGTELM